MSSVQSLSREEMLAKWKEEKVKKTTTNSGKRSLESSSNRRSIIQTTTSKNKTPGASSVRRRTPVSRNSTRSNSSAMTTTRQTPTTAGRPPRSSIQSSKASSMTPSEHIIVAAPQKLLTPADHLQRARRVLRDRNYNTMCGAASASRKRSLSDRSPLASKPLLTKRSSFRSKGKGGSGAKTPTNSLFRVDNTPVGLSISVRRSSLASARPSLSPLSISGFSRDHSPQSQQSVHSFLDGDDDDNVKEEEEEEEGTDSPKAASLRRVASSPVESTTAESQSPAVADDDDDDDDDNDDAESDCNDLEATTFALPAAQELKVALPTGDQHPTGKMATKEDELVDKSCGDGGGDVDVDEQQCNVDVDVDFDFDADVDEQQQSPNKLSFSFDEDNNCSPTDGKSKSRARRSSLAVVPERSNDDASKFSFFFEEDISPTAEPKSRPRRSSLAVVPQARASHDDHQSSPKPSFSFEEDSPSAEEQLLPRRRRTDATFLLLPTPSPFDPLSVDNSLQPSPTSAFSKGVLSPSSIIKTEETAAAAAADEQQQYGVASLQPSPRSAFSKFSSPWKTENNDDDDDIAAAAALPPSLSGVLSRTSPDRKMQIVLEEHEGQALVVAPELDISVAKLQLSPTSAFSKVSSRKQAFAVATDDQDHDAVDPQESSIVDAAIVPTARTVREELIADENDERTVLEDDFSEELSEEQLFVEPVQVNGKTVLESVAETVTTSQFDQIALQNKYKAVLTENASLHNQLSNIRKSYEQRVTPFRDVFEDERKLRVQNNQLKDVSEKIQTQNQQLRKQKEEVDKMVAMLQTQMMTSLQAAVQSSSQLKKALAEANAKIHSLEEELRRQVAS